MLAHHGETLSLSLAGSTGLDADQQFLFMDALALCIQAMQASGIYEHSMIMSSGAVMLYELRVLGRAERVPTDIDWIVKGPGDWNRTNLFAKVAADYFQEVKIERCPRSHFGYELLTPLVQAVSAGGFPCDFVLENMISVCPECHSLIPGVRYCFPVDQEKIFQMASEFVIEGVGPVKVAHPAFVAFYKILMDRNSHGKQDRRDVSALKDLGLLSPEDDSVLEMLDLMCAGYEGLNNSLIELIAC